MTTLRSLVFAALLVPACGSTSPLERELTGDFDADEAVHIDVLDDLWIVDEFPVATDQLPEAIRAAHAKRSRRARIAALVTLRLQQKPGETERAFHQREVARRQDALETLMNAGVRNLHFGASSAAPLQSDASKGR